MVCFHLLIPVVLCVFCQKLPIPDFTSCFAQIGLLWFLFKPQQYWEQWHLREIMLCVGSWWDLWRCGKDLAGHKTKLMVGRRPYLWHIRRSLVWLIQAFRCTHTHFRNYFLGECFDRCVNRKQQNMQTSRDKQRRGTNGPLDKGQERVVEYEGSSISMHSWHPNTLHKWAQTSHFEAGAGCISSIYIIHPCLEVFPSMHSWHPNTWQSWAQTFHLGGKHSISFPSGHAIDGYDHREVGSWHGRHRASLCTMLILKVCLGLALNE